MVARLHPYDTTPKKYTLNPTRYIFATHANRLQRVSRNPHMNYTHDYLYAAIHKIGRPAIRLYCICKLYTHTHMRKS